MIKREEWERQDREAKEALSKKIREGKMSIEEWLRLPS